MGGGVEFGLPASAGKGASNVNSEFGLRMLKSWLNHRCLLLFLLLQECTQAPTPILVSTPYLTHTHTWPNPNPLFWFHIIKHPHRRHMTVQWIKWHFRLIFVSFSFLCFCCIWTQCINIDIWMPFECRASWYWTSRSSLFRCFHNSDVHYFKYSMYWEIFC